MLWRMALLPAAIVFVSAIAIVATNRLNQISPAIRHDVMLLYVGAEDCAPCRSWRRGARAGFRSSPEFLRVSYREVESPTVLSLLKDEYWPDDLREYRDRLDSRIGVPLWFVISDHQIVEQAFGESQWRSLVLPKVKSLLQ